MSKLYSFDLFDTLVTRKLKHPQDVFLCIEASGKVVYRLYVFKLISFSKLRVFSEKLCRFLSKKEDVSIYQIYNVLKVFIKNHDEILEKEFSIEYKVSQPIRDNIDLLNKYLKNGERVCITSDMYLPKNNILKILNDNNIEVDPEFVYVSSEIGFTKGSGNLFKYISKVNNIEFYNIIHYGDNYISDYLVPLNLGIEAVHVGDATLVKSDNFFNIFKCEKSSTPLFDVGFNFCGPLAYCFSYYIYKNNFDNRNIIFGARDSYLFERAFNIFFNKSNSVETYYTRISRSLVYLPYLFFTKKMNYIFEGSLNSDDFFKRIYLKCPDNFKGLSVWSIKKDIEDYLLMDIDFFNLIKDDSFNVIDYLKLNGFNNNCLFVDLGWRGSIQDSLSEILKDIDIKGFYIGTILPSQKKNGFIFDNKRTLSNYFYIMQCITYFEFIFTEPERSLSGIQCSESGFEFLFTNDEDSNQIEIRNEFKYGAENFFMKFKDLNLDLDEEYIFKNIKKLIKKNTMTIDINVIDALKNCSHSAGFNGSLQSSLLNFESFSIMGYLRAPWKAYFMYELKKQSLIKYYIFIALFHNFLFFSFYENFKILFRKFRALRNG